MTSNEAQIDVLLRRYAAQSHGSPTSEHLDPDELSAFAEGALPEGARSRYISHLLDCDNCRQIVSQLAISSGALLTPEAAAAVPSSHSWAKKLLGFFPPLTLRYAAFAMVLITVSGVAYLVVRRPRETNLVAVNEPQKNAADGTVKSPAEALPQASNPASSPDNGVKPGTIVTQPSSQASPSLDKAASLDAPRPLENPTAPAKAGKEGDVTSIPSLAASKKAEPEIAENKPSYAPPPPLVTGQRTETQSRQQQNASPAGGSGPKQTQQSGDLFKLNDRGRTDAAKDVRSEDEASRGASNQAPARKRAADEKLKGPQRNMDNNAGMNRNSNEVASPAVKTESSVASKPRDAEEKTPETRSAGGRKFKRQGSSWVDTKFKSSLTLKSISRGSSDFDALDSGLRSIAQQLGGEVIVVWKGKAYLIK